MGVRNPKIIEGNVEGKKRRLFLDVAVITILVHTSLETVVMCNNLSYRLRGLFN
jgi:hypothetical protein